MNKHTKLHGILTIVWAIVFVLALVGFIMQLMHIAIPALLWLLGVAFISFCSIYANMVGHWSAFEASKGQDGN